MGTGDLRAVGGPCRLLFVGLISALAGGCGTLTLERSLFPDQFVDPSGEPVFVDDLLAITQDTTLLPQQMVNALRDLGLENQVIIDAIIADGLAGEPTSSPDDGGTTDDGSTTP